MKVYGRGPNDLEERIEYLKKQKKLLQDKCRQAGKRIKELELINEEHQKLNGKLRKELDNVRKTSTRIS
jgi:hypothetical protein|tara:strand:- start:269 stop:475 length:207 start_codon:yes stop_codon:yes gene_type:complete